MIRTAFALVPALVLPLLLGCEPFDRTIGALEGLDAESSSGPATSGSRGPSSSTPIPYDRVLDWETEGDGTMEGTLPGVGFLGGAPTTANHWSDGDYLLLDATWWGDDVVVEVEGDFEPRDGFRPVRGAVPHDLLGVVAIRSDVDRVELAMEELTYDFIEHDGLLQMVVRIDLDQGSQITLAADLRPILD